MLSVMEELKGKAKAAGLWNLFLPESDRGAGLTNLEYAPLCEIMGRVHFAPEVFNCSAPDTGNMEVLERYGTAELLQGALAQAAPRRRKIRSAFCMTEPDVASSDATNIQSSIRRDGDRVRHQRPEVVVLRGGRSSLQDPDLHGQDGRERAEAPATVDDPGAEGRRGREREAHAQRVRLRSCAPRSRGDRVLERVRVPVFSNLLLGEGRGFEDRAGAPRAGSHPPLHANGSASPSGGSSAFCKRALSRVAFGKQTSPTMGSVRQDIAWSRIEIDQTRLLTLHAAHMMDTVGNKVAKSEIAAIKVAAPTMALRVLDRAIQVHGGGGVSQDLRARRGVGRHSHLAVRRGRARRSTSRIHREDRACRKHG